MSADELKRNSQTRKRKTSWKKELAKTARVNDDECCRLQSSQPFVPSFKTPKRQPLAKKHEGTNQNAKNGRLSQSPVADDRERIKNGKNGAGDHTQLSIASIDNSLIDENVDSVNNDAKNTAKNEPVINILEERKSKGVKKRKLKTSSKSMEVEEVENKQPSNEKPSLSAKNEENRNDKDIFIASSSSDNSSHVSLSITDKLDADNINSCSDTIVTRIHDENADVLAKDTKSERETRNKLVDFPVKTDDPPINDDSKQTNNKLVDFSMKTDDQPIKEDYKQTKNKVADFSVKTDDDSKQTNNELVDFSVKTDDQPLKEDYQQTSDTLADFSVKTDDLPINEDDDYKQTTCESSEKTNGGKEKCDDASLDANTDFKMESTLAECSVISKIHCFDAGALVTFKNILHQTGGTTQTGDALRAENVVDSIDMVDEKARERLAENCATTDNISSCNDDTKSDCEDNFTIHNQTDDVARDNIKQASALKSSPRIASNFGKMLIDVQPSPGNDSHTGDLNELSLTVAELEDLARSQFSQFSQCATAKPSTSSAILEMYPNTHHVQMENKSTNTDHFLMPTFTDGAPFVSHIIRCLETLNQRVTNVRKEFEALSHSKN